MTSVAPAAFAASPAVGLVCRECGKHSPLAPVHVCDNCFAPLEVEYDEDRLRLDWQSVDVLEDHPSIRIAPASGS